MRHLSRWPRLIRRPATLVSLILAAACGRSAHLADVWTAPAPAHPASSVLVISLDRNASTRRLLEDALAASLKDKGASAVASYTLFPRAAPDTAQVIRTIEDRGFDGVLITHRLTRQRETDVVPGNVQAVPVTRWSPWSGRYYSYWAEVYNPPATVIREHVRTETELWVSDDPARLVWSGTAETVDASSRADVATQSARAIAGDLSKKGLLGASH